MVLDNFEISVFNIISLAFRNVGSFERLRPKLAKWHTNKENLFVVGTENGNCLIREPQTNTWRTIEPPYENLAIEDCSFDPLSEKYLLIAYRDGTMLLYDIENSMRLQHFERQAATINSII